MHALTFHSSVDYMVLSTLGDVLLSHKGFNPSQQGNSYIYNILPWVTEATIKWLTNDWGVGGNQDIPRSSSLWQPHKEIILALYRNLTQLVKSPYFTKRIYQEGGSYLTHLKIALAFNLYGGTSSVKLRICWDKWTAWLKKEPSAFSNSGMKRSSSLAKDIGQNIKQKNGKNMTTAELYTKLTWQKPVQEQNAPPLRVSWKI